MSFSDFIGESDFYRPTEISGRSSVGLLVFWTFIKPKGARFGQHGNFNVSLDLLLSAP